MGRDRYDILMYGTFAARPAAEEDLDGVSYFVRSGTNEGLQYICEEDSGNPGVWIWTPIPVPTHSHSHNHSGVYLEALPEHDNTYHSPNYLSAVPNHGGDVHTGIVGGPVPWGFSMPQDANCPEGAGYWSGHFPEIARAYTAVGFTDVYVKLATAPTANIVFTVKYDDGIIGTVTVNSGVTSGTATLVTPQVVVNGGKVTLDCPVDSKDAKGLCFYVNLQRTSTVS